MRHRTPTITVTRGRFASTAGQVLEQVHAAGCASREEIAGGTGLSVATIGRTVGPLVEARLLRERPDRAHTGAIGRPGIPVEIDTDHFAVLGLHIGRRIATVALGDLAGHVITHRTLRRCAGEAPDLAALARAAADLLAADAGRAPLALGVVAPWRDLGLDEAAIETELAELTGLDVRGGDHIAAVAATEYFHRRQGTTGVTLYVYARDTIGFASAVDTGTGVEVSRVGSLAHFPTGSSVPCRCGRTGCLEVSAGNEAVLSRARAAGLVREDDAAALYAAGPAVRPLLAERARALGAVAAHVRDAIAPDRVVLVGQGFTGEPAVLADVLDAYDQGALPDVPVSFTRFGAGIQAVSSCTVALRPIYDDPFALVSRPEARPTPTSASA
ncbi:ROK family protein [Nocardioides sambongensis]|uniref:ROK family protein n=1 Tax=Nocardioides sambongensis TaxID=2589074 RepID=UPI0015E83AED|nr:ROK family protein [Nocardioides sambongensis]